MAYPELGDIWVDDDGEYILILSEPRYLEQHIYATVLVYNNGTTTRRTFLYSDDGLPEWWTKVA